MNWYKHNYYKLKIIEPDQWLFKVGDKVEILVGKDKGKKGDIVQVRYGYFFSNIYVSK